ncbi:hypothetical protein [Argonema galeatum]|nr:hypothetical protein [Argonema galeatum]MCL1467946.1 hypothetical protein [Argonema galeatum A003/A1]
MRPAVDKKGKVQANRPDRIRENWLDLLVVRFIASKAEKIVAPIFCRFP